MLMYGVASWSRNQSTKHLGVFETWDEAEMEMIDEISKLRKTDLPIRSTRIHQAMFTMLIQPDHAYVYIYPLRGKAILRQLQMFDSEPRQWLQTWLQYGLDMDARAECLRLWEMVHFA